MSTQTTERSDREETERSTRTDGRARAKRAASKLRGRARSGQVLMVAGGAVLVRAITGRRTNRRRTAAKAALGAALLGVGLRKRRAGDDSSLGTDIEGEPGEVADETVTETGVGTVGRRSTSNRPDTNPRGVSAEPDVDTVTEADEGKVRFTTTHDEVSEHKPHLDDVDPKDPRYPDEDDPERPEDRVEVDLSDAAMADEASEAVGPDDEQAYPAREGTDPEPMSDEAPQRYGEGAVANADADEDDRRAEQVPAMEEESDTMSEDTGDEPDATDEGVGDESDAESEEGSSGAEEDAEGEETTASADDSEDDQENDS